MDQGIQPRKIAVNHIQLKVFEAEYFYMNMRAIQDTYLQLNNNLLRGDSPDGHLLRRAFSYNLSAFLSAHRSARYYIVRISNKPGTTGWRKAIDDVPVLKAFHHLRDRRYSRRNPELRIYDDVSVGRPQSNNDYRVYAAQDDP